MTAFQVWRRVAARFLAFALFASVLTIGRAGAQNVPLLPEKIQGNAISDRVLVPQLLPRHIRTFALRADRTGDTPYSSKYYKITNITAEVGDSGGVAEAVNNDGRIAYTDFVSETAYIVNHGGTFGKLVGPKVAVATNAYALNENAEVVGAIDTMSDGTMFPGDIAWRLSGATGSSIAYFDVTGASYGSGDLYSVNNEDVAVGKYGYGAALFEGSSDPPGREFDLRGIRGENCYSFAIDVAFAINDAGEIVGQSCTLKAVRFSLNGYAELFDVSPSGESGAEAINQQGDVAGFAGNRAFLYKDRKAVYLPVPSGDQGPNVGAIAYGINASDEVVGGLYGLSKTYPENYSVFLYVNGRSYDLNTLIPPNSGWYIEQVTGINDRGEIVGWGYYNGNSYGISLEPPK